MKKTLFTAAILAGISGSALASNDQIVVGNAAHPHENTVVVEKIVSTDSNDISRSYELHVDGDQITVFVDGEEVSADQIVNNTEDFRAFHVKGRVEELPKVMLGINLSDAHEKLLEKNGITVDSILVEHVIKGLPADKSGIQDRDIIISIDGSNGMSSKKLPELLQKHNPGDEIQIVVVRNGEKMRIDTTLQPYDAEALGADMVHIERFWSSVEDVFDGTPGGDVDDSQIFFRAFGPKVRDRTHERIMSILRSNGISEDQILEIEAQIDESLDEFVKSVQGVVRVQDDADMHIKGRVMMAESMRKKAEQAMRDAEERLTLQYKDGQLLLKRHTENLKNDEFRVLGERLQKTIPAIESKLESQLDDRLGELEDRLNELEGVLDSRMENLTSLIERLIDRLDEE